MIYWASQAVGSEDMASLNQSSTQVRQALLLLSNQIPQEATYRVARPSLGIRAGKLASYQVTLHGSAMVAFLTRISHLLQEQASHQRRSSSGSSSMTGDRLQTTTRQTLQPIAGVRKSSTPFWNDGSKTDEGWNLSFDGQGNSHYGFPSLYVFREIEQNPAFHRLENHGFRMTLKTTATDDFQARLLLSAWGLQSETLFSTSPQRKS